MSTLTERLHVYCDTSSTQALQMPRTRGQKQRESRRRKEAAVVDTVLARYSTLAESGSFEVLTSEADVVEEIRGSFLTFVTLIWRYGPLIWKAINFLASQWWARNRSKAVVVVHDDGTLH